MMLKGLRPSTKVLEQTRLVADASTSEKLALKPNEEVLFLKRLRSIDGCPIVVVDSFIPLKHFPGLEEEDFIHQSLYGIFREKYATRVRRVVRSIEVMVAGRRRPNCLILKRIGIPSTTSRPSPSISTIDPLSTHFLVIVAIGASSLWKSWKSSSA